MSMKEPHDAFYASKTMREAITKISNLEIWHKNYVHYTSLDRLESMLTGKKPCMWLTRVNSDSLDDLIEGKKYGIGAKKKQGKTFIGCFSYGLRESAAMWGLYCPMTYKAIRVIVPQLAMKSLLESGCYMISTRGLCKFTIYKKSFTDVTYAAVKWNEEEKDRANNLFWNGVFSKQISDIRKDCRCADAVGRVKDIEWSFENESRLIVTTRRKVDADHIAIALPTSFINGIRFTLSPWADEYEDRMVRDKLARLLRAVGRNNVSSENKKVFEPSALKGALTKWAKRRGLD